jgi:acetyl-CoA carboxylase biotin carboxyl carrier protein
MIIPETLTVPIRRIGDRAYDASMVEVRAELSANVWQVRVAVGAHVEVDDDLVVLESMKMEIPVGAPVSGTVAEVRVAPDDKVVDGTVVAVIDPD